MYDGVEGITRTRRPLTRNHAITCAPVMLVSECPRAFLLRLSGGLVSNLYWYDTRDQVILNTWSSTKKRKAVPAFRNEHTPDSFDHFEKSEFL